jgi:RecA/RadA recombinase
MAEYITLMGAEQVQNAARSMTHAAELMQRAASEFQGAVDRQERVLDDFLIRFAAVCDNAKNA